MLSTILLNNLYTGVSLRLNAKKRYGYPLSNQFSGSRRVPQAIKDELNALAAAWCAERRPLPSPATRRAPSTPPRIEDRDGDAAAAKRDRIRTAALRRFDCSPD